MLAGPTQPSPNAEAPVAVDDGVPIIDAVEGPVDGD